jgi:tRNA-specific 2-thiouridylase
LAKKFKLSVALKKDSQGICFLGEVDLKEFLKHYIKEKKGKVVNESGAVIGYHSGVAFYTLGERHGFTITKKNPDDKPYYVIGKTIKKNILIVSQNKLSINSGLLINYKIVNTNWILSTPKQGGKYTAQVRYHGEQLPCSVRLGKENKAEVIFDNPVLVSPGQSIVLYKNDICLGGGIVL